MRGYRNWEAWVEDMVMRCEKFWLRVSFFLTLSLDFEDSFLLRDISNAAKLKIKFRARG